MDISIAPSRTQLAALANHAAPCRKIVALIDTAQVSGPGRQLAAVAPVLARGGDMVHVVLLQRRRQAPQPFAAYLASMGVPHTVLRDDGPFDVRVVSRIRAVLRALKPDLVQTHSYRMTFAVAALRAMGWTTPWIGFFHGATAEDVKVRLYHWLDRRLLRGADAIVVMSSVHADEFRRVRTPVHVVHNAVLNLPPTASQPFTTIANARAAGLPTIGVVGRLSREKGVDVFLDACAQLRSRGASFYAVVAGDGPDRTGLESRSDELGLREHVAFLGPVTDVQGLYRRLDLLVIPSRSEGLPNVLLEGLAADVRVVGTAVGAIPTVLRDPLAGRIVPPESSTALAEAMLATLRCPDSDEARRARREIVERFSLEARAAALRTLYLQVTTRRTTATGSPT